MAVSTGLIGQFGGRMAEGFEETAVAQQASEATARDKQRGDRADSLSTLLRHGDLDDESFDRVLGEFIGTIPSVPGGAEFDIGTISSNREDFTNFLESLDKLESKGADPEALHEAFELGKRRFGTRAGFAAATAGTKEAIKTGREGEEATRQAAIRRGIPPITTPELGTDVAAALEAGRLPKEAAKARTEAQRLTRESPEAIAKKRVATAEAILGRKLSKAELSKLAIQDPFGVLEPFEEEAVIPEGLPPASKHKGRIIDDDETEKAYKSDGTKWIEVE